MTTRTWIRAVLGGVLVVTGMTRPQDLVGQVVGGGATGLEVSVSKPVMGENYDPLSGMLGVEARLARSPTSGIVLQGVLVRSSSGRAQSAVFANPTVGVWMRPAGIPVEVGVSLPLMREFGDDNFATDMARLSDQQHRERYLPGRWAVGAGLTPRHVFPGGAAGMYVGGVAILPRGDRDLDVRARYDGWFSLAFSSRLHGGARFAGTMRLSGTGSLDTRAQQDMSLFIALPGLPGFPELSFRLPVDIDLQDYVSGVVGVRLRF